MSLIDPLSASAVAGKARLARATAKAIARRAAIASVDKALERETGK
jgi:hypothetical protein